MSCSFWLKESFTSFFKEKSSAFLSLFVNTFFFLIFGIFLLITYNLHLFTQKVKDRMEIDVYLVEGLSQQRIEDLRREITRLEGVQGAIFRTKEKALQELKEYLGADILKGLESNPLPSSWVVKLKPAYQNLEKMQVLSSHISKMGGVEETDYGRFWVKKIGTVFKVVLWINLVLGVFIISGSTFLMIHTLKDIRRSKAEELKVLNLLGAKSNFLRTILFWEGAIQGFGSAIVSLSILFVLHRVFSFLGYKINFLSVIISLTFLSTGLILGGLAGFLSGGENPNG